MLATGLSPVSAAHVAGNYQTQVCRTDLCPAAGGTRVSGALLMAERATSSTKTVTKTKKDGTVVTKEVTKTNDGQGNKSTTRTTTTSTSTSGSSQSGGSGGASYEGQ
jgi:hypothetical protein